jgi:RimJ/RimL family protein N-acetyltransferase
VDIVVRRSEAGDFDAWFALYDAVAAEGKWIGGEAPTDREESRRRFGGRLADEDTAGFVAETAGALVGVLGVELHNGIADFGMMIDAEWRGRGIGSQLLEACIAWAGAREAHKVTLTVWPHNTMARRLYRKHGFIEEGRLRRHYRRRSGELWDAVVMGLVLDENSPGSPYQDEPSDGGRGG